MKIVGIIPARMDSKSIKNKNIVDLGNKPLIAWTIDAAIRSKLDKVIVSTDNPEIANISMKFGAEVPFLRPKHLALDTAHSIDVVKHTLDNIDMNPIAMMLLQPTSPFRSTKQINESIKLFDKSDTNSCISLCKIQFPPEWSISIGEKNLNFPFWSSKESPFNLERQQLPAYYKPNGAIYITRVGYLRYFNNLIDINSCCQYIMDERTSFDIDTELDYKLAKEMVK
jgi:CMP-N-acetylneuraminic acid synthetase